MKTGGGSFTLKLVRIWPKLGVCMFSMTPYPISYIYNVPYLYGYFGNMSWGQQIEYWQACICGLPGSFSQHAVWSVTSILMYLNAGDNNKFFSHVNGNFQNNNMSNIVSWPSNGSFVGCYSPHNSLLSASLRQYHNIWFYDIILCMKSLIFRHFFKYLWFQTVNINFSLTNKWSYNLTKLNTNLDIEFF